MLLTELIEAASTSFPNSELNQDIRTSVNNKLKITLLQLLNSIEKALGISLPSLVETVNGLDCSLRINPALFLVTFNLQSAMDSGDVQSVLDKVQWLKICFEHSPYTEDVMQVTSILSEYWEVDYIEKLRQYDQKNIRGEGTIVRPIIDHLSLAEYRSDIESAIFLIKTYDRELFDELSIFVHKIKLFQGRVLRGDSSSTSFGSIWLRVPEPEDDQVGYWVEHLIHEVSHLRLEALFFHEDLVLNSKSEKKFRAPIRDDLRPMFGIFHGTFVLARMVRIFRRLSIAGYEKRFRDRLQLCNLQFEKGRESLNHPEAKFSNNGLKIKDSLIACSLS